jgi:lipoprotein signal peptidase
MTGVGRAALITAGAAAATFAVDRALKVAVEHVLDEGEQVRGPLGIRIRRQHNEYGIAGTEQGSGANTALLVAGGALALGIAGAATMLRRPTMVQVGAGMVAGAMAANLVDRAVKGSVTDFLPSPLGVLNAADIALGAGIVVGGLGMALR